MMGGGRFLGQLAPQYVCLSECEYVCVCLNGREGGRRTSQ